jgi:hypothetical protein
MKIYSYSLAIFKLQLYIHIQLEISNSLFLNPNYFDTLQFEANTHHPTTYGMQSRFKTFIQALYAKTIEKKINLCLGTCISLTLTLR